MSEQSSSQQQIQQINPTSPPTNMVSVLSKMLETAPKTVEQEVQVPSNKRKFYFYLDFPIDNQIQKCQVQVEEAMKVQEAFTQALQKFKVILAQKGYQMDTELSNYTPRLAKKNGKPKTDMPSIDLKQKFIDLKVTVSSIQIKNPECIKGSQQEVLKTTSHYSIGSEIGDFNATKKQQMLSQQEIMRKNKNQNCMFSFC